MRFELGLFCVVAAAACGGDDATSRGPVRVTVTAGEAPVAGLTAVFLDPAGAELARAVTDQSGQASAEVGEGAALTVVQRFSYGVRLWTVSGLEPGDDISIDDVIWGQPAGSMTVSFPAPDGDIGGFALHHACSSSVSGVPTMQADFFSQCARERVDFLVEETGGEQFLHLLDVPLVDGESVTIPGDASSWQPTRPVGAAMRGPGLDQVLLEWRVESANGTWYGDGLSEGGDEQRAFHLPAGFGVRSRAMLSTTTESGGRFHQRRQERVYPGLADEVLIDVSDPGFLPSVDGASLAPDSQVVDVDVSGEGDWDMTMLLADFTSGGGDDVLWDIAAPGGTTRIELAALLPADLHELLPAADQTGALASLVAVDGDGSVLRRAPWSPREALEAARPGDAYILQTSTSGTSGE